MSLPPLCVVQARQAVETSCVPNPQTLQSGILATILVEKWPLLFQLHIAIHYWFQGFLNIFLVRKRHKQLLQLMKSIFRPNRITHRVSFTIYVQPSLHKLQTLNTTSYIAFDMGEKGWKQVTVWLNFGIFNRSTDPLIIETAHSLLRDFRADKTFKTRWSGCRVQVWVQVRGFEPLPVIWQSFLRLFQNPVYKRRFWLQSQQLSSFVAALRHSLGE